MSALVVGAVLAVNSMALNANDALASAHAAVNAESAHQIATVLELYYLDHGSYPNVQGGEALISVLENGGYLQSQPLDPSVFTYAPKDGGQDYTLDLTGE